MPNYDFQCRVCGEIVKDVFIPLDELPFRGTYHCEVQMRRLPPAPAFAVHGFNAKNGYAKGS